MTPPLSQVCSAIRDLVSTGKNPLLSEEQVDNIAKSLATPDERKTLLAYASSRPPAPANPPGTEGSQAMVPVLGAAEQLLIGLLAIPMLEVKLGCVRLGRSFGPRLQAVNQAVSTLSDACEV